MSSLALYLMSTKQLASSPRTEVQFLGKLICKSDFKEIVTTVEAAAYGKNQKKKKKKRKKEKKKNKRKVKIVPMEYFSVWP
jgi:hypothetical protein